MEKRRKRTSKLVAEQQNTSSCVSVPMPIIVNKNLSIYARLAYIHIKFIEESGRDCMASLMDFTELIGCHIITARRALRELEKHKIISITTLKTESGTRRLSKIIDTEHSCDNR